MADDDTRPALAPDYPIATERLLLRPIDPVGDIILIWSKEHPSDGEVGYIVDPEHQGRGYATEAVSAVLALGFDGLGLHRVVGRIDARNPASGRVLTKAGMRQEAVLVENEWFKGEWGTEVDFAILEREWRALRGRPDGA